MDNQILAPDAVATATALKPEFGSPPLFTNPFTSPTTSTTTPSEHTSKYLNHLNTLGFSQAEQAIIIKLNLDWILCHTKWPAFHWDMGALESSARDWVGSRSRTGFGFGADFLHWEPRASMCDLRGERIVGPTDFSSRSNYAPGPPIADNLGDLSDGDIVNDDTAEDAKAEDIPRCGTPDFESLQSSPSSTKGPNSPNPTNIPLPMSHSGSGGSSEYSESASHGGDLGLGLDSVAHFELAPIEVEETEVRSMIGRSLVTLLDSDGLDVECFRQMLTTDDLDVDSYDERPAVVHGTSAHEDESATDTISKSPEAGSARSDSLSPDVFYKTPIDPVKLSKLTQLSTIPVAGDPSLLRLLSTLAVPPFPESQSDPLRHPIPPTPAQIQTQLQIFKKDAELCTKSQIMDTQGTIVNEVGAQLRCGCDKCRPVAMKALFGDWDGMLF